MSENTPSKTITTIIGNYKFFKMSADELADHIGIVDRHTYFELLTAWVSEYEKASEYIRTAKRNRKGASESDMATWNSRRETGRVNARRMMTLRSALTIMARRHREALREANRTPA